MHMLTDVEKLQTVPLLIRGQAKLWFDGLKSSDRRSWQELQRQFLKQFEKVITPEEAGAKLKAIRQDVSKDFSIFIEQFEACWKQLEVATGVKSNQY
ncbi:hypothetical protein L7F22_058042 [Adiantum nelumboides]|nr:hypothetical protein [Adiantum nelumboides]